MEISEKLKRLMVERGFTQESLGKRAYVSQNAIWKIVQGKTKKPQKLPEICQALGISVDDFLNYGEESNAVIDTSKSRLLRKVQTADPKDLPSIEQIVDAITLLRIEKNKAGID